MWMNLRLTMDTLQSKEYLTYLPQEIKEHIFRHLTATDLCHVALCNRILREAANRDTIWRPLCRKKGWERYGTICDLCKEPPFEPTSQDEKTGVGGVPTFPGDAVVTGSDWPGLVDTCKWKEVYMKACHLEENWRNHRFYTTSLALWSSGGDSMACEGECLAVGSDDGTLEIWDLAGAKRHPRIEHEISLIDTSDTLKMKDGIIAAGCSDGKIRTYSAQTGKQLQVMSGHRLAVSRLFLDGDSVVSVAHPQFPVYEVYEDSDIRVWSAANGASLCILQSGHEATRLLHLDYKDKIVAGAYSDNKICIWDARNGSCMQQIVCDMEHLASCNLGDGIVIGTFKDFLVKIWELQYGECIKTFDLHPFQGIQPSEIPFDGHDEEAHYKFIDGLLVVVTLLHGFYIVNLDGQRLLRDSRRHVKPVCLKGNKLLIWSRETCRYELWTIDPVRMDDRYEVQGSSKTKASSQHRKETQRPRAWMSDTKLIFQGRLISNSPATYISVHHYW
ncbi:F-box/WD repeat-containing protein 7-like [Patiria miniata]|uniref:F-box domain-containing protein n=1 Tax=Patiria miniata TaxID=46514 RepID=A0A913Z2S8_PATMI|nr:F-box/WD repeat-containing protein 7-like [Patiria miniata]XP_038045081.1 F-box/WD repeat-containing protein 7-like [Patiria miniata]